MDPAEPVKNSPVVDSGWVEEEKQAFRSVVRKIHPDRFMQYPEESNVNNTSLAALNAFLEAYVQGKAVVRSTRLLFFTLEKKKLQKIEVENNEKK